MGKTITIDLGTDPKVHPLDPEVHPIDLGTDPKVHP